MNRITIWRLGGAATVLGVAAATILVVGAPHRALPDEANSGQISGKISFNGERPKLARIMMNQDPICASLHSEPVFAEDGAVNSDGTLPNVFVYVQSGLRQANFPAPKSPVILDQQGCIYVPHVLGIMVGQELRVLTSDPTTHNVHPMPKVNREWNQSQIPGAAPIVKKFIRPEIMIPVKCNPHPWMTAYIGVTTNPFYAVTGKDGTFTIKDLPPGNYTLAAWTATFGTQQQNVTVSSGGSATVNFTFTPAP